MKTKLTKVKGDRSYYPIGFWVEGTTGMPRPGYAMYMNPMTAISHEGYRTINMNWFLGPVIEKLFPMDWGYLLGTDDHEVWKLEEIP